MMAAATKREKRAPLLVVNQLGAAEVPEFLYDRKLGSLHHLFGSSNRRYSLSSLEKAACAF